MESVSLPRLSFIPMTRFTRQEKGMNFPVTQILTNILLPTN